MDINFQIKYFSYNPPLSWLCFNHAVKKSLEGIEILTEIDDFSSDYYMGTTICVVCSKEGEEGADES